MVEINNLKTNEQNILFLPDFDVIRQQPSVYGLGGVGHENPPLELEPLQKPWQRPRVIQMEAGDWLKFILFNNKNLW